MCWLVSVGSVGSLRGRGEEKQSTCKTVMEYRRPSKPEFIVTINRSISLQAVKGELNEWQLFIIKLLVLSAHLAVEEDVDNWVNNRDELGQDGRDDTS